MVKSLRLASAAVALGAAVAVSASSAGAAIFTDSFTRSNDVAVFSFSSDGSTPITIQTITDQTPDNLKGFDTVLALFNGAGDLILNGFDVFNLPGDVSYIPDLQDLGTGSDDYNARLSGVFPLGSYSLALAQYDNFPSGSLSDPNFSRMSDPFYTKNEFFCAFLYTTQACGQFDPVERQAVWKLSIDGATAAAYVPIPAALPLMGSALALLGAVALRRRHR